MNVQNVGSDMRRRGVAGSVQEWGAEEDISV
jgi:hypothetical protein